MLTPVTETSDGVTAKSAVGGLWLSSSERSNCSASESLKTVAETGRGLPSVSLVTAWLLHAGVLHTPSALWRDG